MKGAEKIRDFLLERLGFYYCPECLCEETQVRAAHVASRISGVLLRFPRDFSESPTCDSCCRKRRSIAFVPRL